MKFIVHDHGDWVQSDTGWGAIRINENIKEYNSLDDMDDWNRSEFEYMMKNRYNAIWCGKTLRTIKD